ncbi:hypothetical protein GCM10009122_40060 [Fulvivirga kasyanovii]|uniref:hypothetical protein n=1 Tax=Fulvivirga kasyanovii TaxID=396812 RepID=UPI0031D5DC9C
MEVNNRKNGNYNPSSYYVILAVLIVNIIFLTFNSVEDYLTIRKFGDGCIEVSAQVEHLHSDKYIFSFLYGKEPIKVDVTYKGDLDGRETILYLIESEEVLIMDIDEFHIRLIVQVFIVLLFFILFLLSIKYREKLMYLKDDELFHNTGS